LRDIEAEKAPFSVVCLDDESAETMITPAIHCVIVVN